MSILMTPLHGVRVVLPLLLFQRVAAHCFCKTCIRTA
jgi:hypothetical protein